MLQAERITGIIRSWVDNSFENPVIENITEAQSGDWHAPGKSK